MSSATTRYLIWISQAKFDLEAAQNSFNNKFFEWTCYQSVQAAEKVLKAVLIHAGTRPPKIHKLGVLLSMCNHANPEFKVVRLNYRKLETFTFISRYPFILPGTYNTVPHDLITKDDAIACLNIAKEVIQQVEEFLGKKEASSQEPMDMETVYYTRSEIDSRLNSLKNLITQDPKLNAKKIILFGSFARELTRPRTSTMDILIIADTEMPFIERISYLRELTRDEEPIIEPLIYTPNEFELMTKEEGEGFLESAIDEGRVIWEKTA